MIHCIRQTKVN